MVPTSTYGASKLAGEAILAAYAAMFDFTVRAFRFGNVVGPHQTHGVGFDFVRRLLDDPTRLRILGDGRQSKSYIYVEDVIDAVLTAGALADTPFDAFNVATGDYVTVTEIAELAMQVLGLAPGAPLRLHRRRPGLEGRRAGGADQHRQDPVPRLEQPAHRAAGAPGLHALHGRRRAGRPADVVNRRRGVFLDRDGVLNQAFVTDGVPPPPAARELRLLPGVAETCRRSPARPRPGRRDQPARHCAR